MTKVKSVTVSLNPFVTALLMVFVALFDKDSASYGMLWSDAPAWLSTVATLAGNVVWLLGVLFVAFIHAMFTLLVDASAFDKVRVKSREKILSRSWFQKTIIPVVTIATSLFLISSNYWFTGTSWFIALLISIFYRHSIVKDS